MKINYKLLLIFLIFLFFFYIYIKKQIKENFTENKNMNFKEWPEDLKNRFIEYQNTMAQNDFVVDLEVIQQQATAKEAEEYLKTGYWNWDEQLKQLYMDKVSDSTLVKIVPEYSLDYAMRKYTSKAVEQILAWNYKEGEFLMYGVINSSPSIQGIKNENIIKCSNDDEPVLEDSNGNKIEDEDIPNVIKGFSFIGEKCNPCVAVKQPMDKSCPFKLKVNKDDTGEISEIWNRIWFGKSK